MVLLRRRWLFGIALLLPALALGDGYSFQTLNDPADNALQTPVFNQLLGINDSGVIVGYYGDGATVPNNGFVYTGSFTPANVSGAAQTQVVAINNTQSGGSFGTAGFYVDGGGNNHGFTKMGGTTTTQDGGVATFTQTLGLNDANMAVGVTTAAGNVTEGFVYNTQTKSLTPLAPSLVAGANALTATGINNAGVIVGFTQSATGAFSDFIDKNNMFTSVADPNGTNPMFFGINNNGQIVGTDTASGGYSEGFVYNMNSNTWTTVFDPASSTAANGFGISGTVLNGINDNGELVGFIAGPGGAVDGLLVTTPEPISVGLAGLGLCFVLFVTNRRRRQASQN